MFRRVSATAIALLAVTALGVSACSNSNPASPSSAADQQTSPAASQAATQTKAPDATSAAPSANNSSSDSDLESKILTGQAAGVTFQRLPQLPDMDKILQNVDAQIEPADCASTGLTQLVAGSAGSNDSGVATVLLSTDTAAPGKYTAYAQKCTSVTGTVNGSPLKQTLSMDQAPDIDGASDLVAVKSEQQFTTNGKETDMKTYVVIGTAESTTIMAQSASVNGQDPDPALAVEVFKAQAEKLKS